MTGKASILAFLASALHRRKELRAKKLPLPNDEDLIEISFKFNAWIESYIHDYKLDATTTTWYTVFKDADADGNGTINFDELTTCVRQELKKGPSIISHDELRALWCASETTTIEREPSVFSTAACDDDRTRAFSIQHSCV